MNAIHPQRSDRGLPVIIGCPSTPTPLDAWQNPEAIAVVVPGGPMPPELSGIPFDDWAEAPTTLANWACVEGLADLEEPEMPVLGGFKTSAGAIILELDGRIWIVHPTNAYGGYKATFPKGTVDDGLPLQASAIKEAYEECGLKVEINGFLADVKRSTSVTRYYLARRVGGNPASMGWESQAVALVPKDRLGECLTNKYDLPLLEAIQKGL